MSDFNKLLAGLQSTREKIRAKSAFELGCSGQELALEPLISAFNDPSVRVRRQVVFALSKFNDSRVTDTLILALDDSDIEVRRKSIAALHKSQDSKAVTGLTSAFQKEADGYMRACLLSALGRINDMRSRDLFISALNDSELDVRVVALAIQKQVSDPKAVAAVIALLDDDYLCGRAIRILGNLGDFQAIEPLEKFARNFSASGHWGDYCRQSAQEAIVYIQQGKQGSFPLWI